MHERVGWQVTLCDPIYTNRTWAVWNEHMKIAIENRYIYIYIYFAIFTSSCTMTRPTIIRGNATESWFPYCYRRCPSVPPSVPPSRWWLMLNGYGTVKARKTVSAPFDRVMPGDFPCQTASPKTQQFYAVHGVRNRWYFTASKYRQNSRISGNITTRSPAVAGMADSWRQKRFLHSWPWNDP